MPSAAIDTGSRTVLAVLIACLLIVGTTATVVTAAPAHVSVSSMTVSDDEPEAGDTITLTPTLRHSSSGSGSFEMRQVVLEDAGGTRYAEADDLGTLGTGDTIDVPLRATVETAAEKKFVVHVRGVQYDSDGRWSRVVHIKHPTYVSVSEPDTSTEPDPQLNVHADDLTAGDESTVRVTVSNGGDDELTDLSLHLSGLGGVENLTRLRPSLGATNSTTFRFDVRPSEAGTYPLNATLRYDDGDSVDVTKDVEVEALRDDASVHATVSEQNESTLLHYRVSNHGNAPLKDVVVSGAAVGTPLPTTVIPTVEAGMSETVTVELNEWPSGPATVSATYGVGSATGETSQTVQFGEPTATEDEATATEDGSAATNDARRLENPFGPLSLLTGGFIATGSILGYRTWREGR